MLISSEKFYSWYIYPENDKDYGKSISAAEYIEDVNEVRFQLAVDVVSS